MQRGKQFAAPLLFRSLPGVLCAILILNGAAFAGDPWEFWPEVNLFVGLNPQTRLYLVAAYAGGKESDVQTLDLAGYLDISIMPILRTSLRHEDWQRTRFLWARIGYDHIFKATEGTRDTSEDRGIVSVYAKAELPGQVWLEGRARADLRWIGGDYSTRYRARIEATREFTVLDHAVVPYLNAEYFYDTRYNGWARAFYMAGAEFTVTKHFRFELYLSRQKDDLPSPSALNAFGAVGKWYY